MDELFGPSGLFAGRFPGFEYRQQQVELAEQVQATLSGAPGSTLAAEAPPGVGKTFALLAPAMLWAAERGKTILVLTGGIPLQEQLIHKDLPALESILGLGLSYGLLKGRGNYVCLLRAEETTGAAGAESGYLSYGDGGEASRQVEAWIRRTTTGDLSELSLPPNSPAVLRIAASSRTCLGFRCPLRDACFAQKVLKDAQGWSVVVANYHLFFSYILGSGNPFPLSYDLLICDEAHRIPDAARSSMTVTASRDDLIRLLRSRVFLTDDSSSAVRETNEERNAVAAEIRQEAVRFYELLEVKCPQAKAACTSRNEELWHQQQIVSEKIRTLLDMVAPETGGEGEEKDGAAAIWAEELERARTALEWCASVGQYPEWAYWKDGPSLSSAPVVSSDEAAQCLQSGAAEKSLFVSATLTLGGTWDYWMRESGIRPTAFFIGGTPFDLEAQMEIVVVDTGLSVTAKEYDGTICRVVEKLTEANGGRTLVLASSHRLLNKLRETFRRKKRPYAVLVQGDLPRTELLELFRKDETSVLIGSASFREGVDVPGDGLTQVIIDRIPFPHPGDPLVQARTTLEGQAAFCRSTLPEAKMVLKQAAGRLIRSKTDSGRVVIVDGRVLDRKDWNIPGVLPTVRYRRLLVPSKSVAPSDAV